MRTQVIGFRRQSICDFAQLRSDAYAYMFPLCRQTMQRYDSNVEGLVVVFSVRAHTSDVADSAALFEQRTVTTGVGGTCTKSTLLQLGQVKGFNAGVSNSVPQEQLQ